MHTFTTLVLIVMHVPLKVFSKVKTQTFEVYSNTCDIFKQWRRLLSPGNSSDGLVLPLTFKKRNRSDGLVLPLTFRKRKSGRQTTWNIWSVFPQISHLLLLLLSILNYWSLPFNLDFLTFEWQPPIIGEGRILGYQPHSFNKKRIIQDTRGGLFDIFTDICKRWYRREKGIHFREPSVWLSMKYNVHPVL